MATLLRTAAGRRADALVERVADNPVLSLSDAAEPGAAQPKPAPPSQTPPHPQEPSRALALGDMIAVRAPPTAAAGAGDG